MSWPLTSYSNVAVEGPKTARRSPYAIARTRETDAFITHGFGDPPPVEVIDDDGCQHPRSGPMCDGCARHNIEVPITSFRRWPTISMYDAAAWAILNRASLAPLITYALAFLIAGMVLGVSLYRISGAIAQKVVIP